MTTTGNEQRTPEPIPIEEQTSEQRKRAAIDLLEDHICRTGREMTGVELQARTGGGPNTPMEVSWDKIQNYLDTHPGFTYNRYTLHQATGVPVSTISYL